jgi:hypothetical protein
MNDPVRWRDDPDAPSELREAFSKAQPSRRMTAEQFARGSRRLAAGTAAASGVFFGLKGTAWAALIGGGLIAIGAVTLVRQSRPSTTSMQTSMTVAASRIELRPPPAPAAELPSAPVVEAAPTSEPVVTPPVSSIHAPTAARDSLAEEAELIEQARTVVASDPNRALNLLDQHQKRFARGKLGMERELLRVDALRRAGRTAEARSLVETLLARTKNSIYEARLRQLQTALGAK